MNVKQLKEILSKFPDNAQVQVGGIWDSATHSLKNIPIESVREEMEDTIVTIDIEL